MMTALFLAVYITVFAAELMGDKLLYTISTLAIRYRPVPMLSGVCLAFMGKMAAAVVLGGLVARLPAKLVAVISAVTFFTMALALSFKAPESPADSRPLRWPRVFLISFAVIFFSEWGDMGQVTAAALAARYQSPLLVWVAATLAMITKAVLSMTVGRGLVRRLPQKVLRYCGAALLFTFGVLSLAGLINS
jgi:putative Ca2+/H+ antiporter (TMEM165/GDT1 family)